MAAKFEFEDNESVETARHLLQRALRLMPRDSRLWVEYFKMELMCVDLVLKRKELLGVGADGSEAEQDQGAQDAILTCKVVEVVFINAIKQVESKGCIFYKFSFNYFFFFLFYYEPLRSPKIKFVFCYQLRQYC